MRKKSLGSNLLVLESGVGSLSSTGALALDLHKDNRDNDDDPVHTVAGDGADRGNVGPADNGVQELPASGVGVVRVAAVKCPNVPAGVVRTGIVGITSNNLVPLVHLKGHDGLSEQTSGNEEQEAGRGDEEAVEGQAGTSTVDDETDKGTGQDTANGSERNGLGLLLESHTSDEDHGFQTLAENGDEGQDQEGVLARALGQRLVLVNVVHRLGELSAPLFLHVLGLQHGQGHDGDHETGNQSERTLPQLLVGLEDVLGQRVPILPLKKGNIKNVER